MSGTWPMVILNVLWVVGLTMLAWFAADAATSGPMAEALVYAAVAGALLLGITGAPLRYFLLQQRAQSARRETLLSIEAARRDFESRLARAMDMADDEPAALHAAMLAMGTMVDDALVEVLLADSSRAHLAVAASSEPADAMRGCGCDVTTPRSCPAIRSGHHLTFEDSSRFDACPHVRDRECGALTAICMPVSVVGAAVGVVHVTRPAERPFDRYDVTALAAVSQQLGSRIGLVRAMTQSQLQASTDPLTGLLNRRSLENEVRLLTQDARPFGLILLDLDHFKILNDTHGHDAGDRALRIFARLLQRSVRDHDLVCRYGGEEFIIVLPDRDLAAAMEVFDRIRLELAVACSDGHAPSFTASAGIADTTEAATLSEVISLADNRLLRAKDQGRDCAVVS
ncbi:MAG: GGDEF domain-containing protein [Ilumatobacter sp.]|nr:GGDEF domain-containing protein [Ilumatobacter sp.]MCB0984701.1 GGDEF domain-containing protein [Ilumatobacter sp.]